MISRAIIVLVLFVSQAARPTGSAPGDSPTIDAPRTDGEIAARIQDLGDSSYDIRTSATQRLIVAGNRSRVLLDKAAAGTDTEIALRARQLLAVLDRLWFLGVDVTITFDKQDINWNEPVELQVTFSNGSEYPARLPIETAKTGHGNLAIHAAQVGLMLDIADSLTVTAPDGREIDLHVDDIQADPDVADAVEKRLDDGPVTTLEPGKKLRIKVPEFNRGWARYRMLNQGQHSVRFVYEPEWEDKVLAANNACRVVSPPATINIRRGAPKEVSRGGAIASLALERVGAVLIARLTNQTDHEMLVNKHFGASAPFAVGHWVYAHDDAIHEVSVAPDSSLHWNEYDVNLLVSVPPGGSVELARTGLAGLLDVLRNRGADLQDNRWTIHFTYSSLLGGHWQRRQGSALLGNSDVPTVLSRPLSRRILSAQHASNRLVVPR